MFFSPIHFLIHGRQSTSPHNSDVESQSGNSNLPGLLSAALLTFGSGVLKHSIATDFNGSALVVTPEQAHSRVLDHNLNYSAGLGEGSLIRCLNSQGQSSEVKSFCIEGARIKFIGYVHRDNFEDIQTSPPSAEFARLCYQISIGDKEYPLILNPGLGQLAPVEDGSNHRIVIHSILVYETPSTRHGSRVFLIGPHPYLGSDYAG